MQTLNEAKDSVEHVEIEGFEIIAAYNFVCVSKYCMYSGVDGCVRVYDIRNRGYIQDSISRPITAVVSSNDKNCLLTACLDDTMRLLDKEQGDILAE